MVKKRDQRESASPWSWDNTKRKREQARIFLASPSDVIEYRNATKLIVDEFNSLYQLREGKSPFFLYMWEENKTPGFTNNYQEDIFQEFGYWCDIFILILWHKIGQGGTEKEYQKFIDTFKENNPQVKLYVANTREPIDPMQINEEQLGRLKKFIESHQDNWSLLGNVRGAIKSVEDYERFLRAELQYYHGKFLN